MGYTDAKGRPELVVHPDIKLGRAVYRPADTTPPTTPQDRDPSPRQKARRAQLDAIKQARSRTGDTTSTKR